MTERSPLEKTRPPHYPRAFSKKIKGHEVLFRQVPVHPARFVVGMDEPEWPLFPPPDKVEGTAIQYASYVARVQEVDEDGNVTVTLWERPNGREGLTALSVDEHLGGQRPNVGDLLWIWTWIDVVNRRRKKRIYVEREQPKLTHADRQLLGSIAEQLTRSGE